MSFFSWLARKGTVGETARVVGQQYLMLKKQNPNAADEDIFGTILAARHAAKPYTVAQLARLEASADYSESVGEFVLELVLTESSLGSDELPEAQMSSLMDAVSRELQGMRLA